MAGLAPRADAPDGRAVVTINTYAGMAELADAPDLGSGAARNAASTPVTRTIGSAGFQ